MAAHLINFLAKESSDLTFTPDRALRLRQFWPTGRPLRLLAEEWHCTVGYVSAKAKVLGLPSRQAKTYQQRVFGATRFVNGLEARTYFDFEAARRGISPRQLEALIVQVVTHDRLVNAILDDEKSLLEKAA